MENIAKVLDADIAEYNDGKDRHGLFGYLRACCATVKFAMPRVTIKGDVDLKAYDRVIIGMPVWVEGPCAVGRAFIKKYSGEFPSEVYYVVTHEGLIDYNEKIKAMDKLLGRASQGQVSIRTKNNDYVKAGVDYASTLI